jgi:hypothetical protein
MINNVKKMDILKSLEGGHSKALTMAIVYFIRDNPDQMEVLMDLFFNGHFRINQRAAWPIGIIGEKYPILIRPYLSKLVSNLDKENLHDAVVRNTLRTFQTCEIPEEVEGPLYEKCFGYLLDMKSPIAFKAFGMSVLARIADKFPDLKEELIAVIEEQYEFGTAGFKARAKRVLKKLKT